MSIWNEFEITWNFVTRVCGSQPADPDVVDRWVKSRMPTVKPVDARSITEITEEVLETLAEQPEGQEEVEKYQMLVLPRMPRGPGGGELTTPDAEGRRPIVVRGDTIRAHLKDCAGTISGQLLPRVPGMRSFNTRFTQGVYTKEYWVPLQREDGSLIYESDGAFDRFVHARLPNGQRINALKRIEYLEPPVMLRVTLLVAGTSVREEDLRIVMEYGSVHGYGGERSRQEGRYLADIKLIKEADFKIAILPEQPNGEAERKPKTPNRRR